MSRESDLEANGCKNPDWYLRNHIPRFAEHYGVDMATAFQLVLGEVVALHEVRTENFKQMIEAGTARKMLRIYAKRGDISFVGERPLIIIDNYVTRVKRPKKDEPEGTATIYYDPYKPLAIQNFRVMDDPIDTQCVSPIVIGRPNAYGELWVDEGISVEDYDVVRDCFKRLLALRTEGTTPHLDHTMDHIFIPFTLGSEEYPFDPTKFHHGPVDYNGIATDLRTVS